MTERGAVLDEAKELINGERQNRYGNPENNFSVIAGLWGVSLERYITAHDVAIMMCLLKIGRILTGNRERDSYVDLCGYAALAADFAEKEEHDG